MHLNQIEINEYRNDPSPHFPMWDKNRQRNKKIIPIHYAHWIFFLCYSDLPIFYINILIFFVQSTVFLCLDLVFIILSMENLSVGVPYSI